MKKLKLLIASLLMACLSVGALTGCDNGNQGKTNSDASTNQGGSYDKTVTLGFSTWIGYAPLFVAKEKGFFDKEGVKVDLKIIESDGDKKAAMAAKQLQGTAGTIDTHVMGIDAGLDQVQVLALDTSNGADGVVSKKGINSLEDLKGKKVALDTTGGASLFYFNYLLDQNGMNMKDLDIQNMSAGDAGSAFVSGKVDAAVTWEPWLTNAKKTEFGKVLQSSADTPGVIVDTLSFDREFDQKYPDSIRKIVNAWFDAVEYCKTNPDEANKIMAKAMGMSDEDFATVLPTVKYYDKDDNNKYFREKTINEVSKKAGELWLKLGLIKNMPDTDSSIDSKFVLK